MPTAATHARQTHSEPCDRNRLGNDRIADAGATSLNELGARRSNVIAAAGYQTAPGHAVTDSTESCDGTVRIHTPAGGVILWGVCPETAFPSRTFLGNVW